MRILLDENVARPLHAALRTFVTNHQLTHVLDLDGWSGTKDVQLYRHAADEGFDAILTNDEKQLHRPLEVAAIAESGLHRIQYGHRNQGLIGLGVAIGSVCSGLPLALAEMEQADSQRLIQLRGIDPTAGSRLRIVNPRLDPPKFWPTTSAEK